jgi:(R)-2-hydroxyacyl-CoA dehydratese activating ATPase
MKHRFAGIDIGSRTVKIAIFEDSTLIENRVEYHTHDPLSTARSMLSSQKFDSILLLDTDAICSNHILIVK